MRLRDFKVLSFDCYGTLIDWESGLWAALQPLLARAKPGLDRDAALGVRPHGESAQEADTPAMRYRRAARRGPRQARQAWGAPPDAAEAARFGASVPDWPAFPDTPAALAELKRHYRLVILSNVDRASFAGSAPRLGVAFDDVSHRRGDRQLQARPAQLRLSDRAAGGARLREDRHPACRHRACSTITGRPTMRALPRPGSTAAAAAVGGATAMPERMPHYDWRFASLAELAEARRREEA